MEQYINFVHSISLLDNTSLMHSLILAFFSLWAKWDKKDYSKSCPFKKLRGFGNEESWMSKAVEWRYTKSETLSLAKWAWTAKETSSNLTNPCISGVWQPKIPSRIQQKSDPRGWGACFPKRELVGRSEVIGPVTRSEVIGPVTMCSRVEIKARLTRYQKKKMTKCTL